MSLLPVFCTIPWSTWLLKDYGEWPHNDTAQLSWPLGQTSSEPLESYGQAPATIPTSSLPSDSRSVFPTAWVFVPDTGGPAVLLSTEVKKLLRTSVFSELLVTDSPLLFNSRPVFFSVSACYLFSWRRLACGFWHVWPISMKAELLPFKPNLCTTWQCPCSSQWVFTH